MDNKAWKVGDSVMAVGTIPGFIEKGKEYTIDGFGCCPKCGQSGVSVKEVKDKAGVHFNCCDIKIRGIRTIFAKKTFIRPDLSSLTQYREEISVREITIPTELKELKNLEN